MVMGPTHAVSGAVAWLAGAGLVTSQLGYRQSPAELAVYTAVCAGAALLPDLDCSGAVLKNKGGATVARTFGVASLFLAECVEKLSLGIYKLTRTKRDGKRTNGHRTFTHTWVFAALLTLGVTQLVAAFPRGAVIGILFFMLGLAMRGLMAEWAAERGWITITLMSLTGAIVAAQVLPADNYPLLGIAIGVGCVVHTFGDMITRAGCPVLWPIPFFRETWYEFGLPDAIAIKAGGKFEKAFLLPALFVAACGAVLWQLPGRAEFLGSLADLVSG